MPLKKLLRKLWPVRYYIAAFPAGEWEGDCAATAGAAAFGGCWYTGVFDSKKNAVRYLEWYNSTKYALLPDRIVRLDKNDVRVLHSKLRGAP